MDEDIRITLRNEILNGRTQSIQGDISRENMALNTTINSGGVLVVYEAGIANSTTINDRGRLSVWIGGRASNTTINSGGIMSISRGSAFKTTLNSGGVISAFGGGSEYNVFVSTTVNSGAVLDMRRFTTAAFYDVVENGGYVLPRSNTIISFASNVFTGVELSYRGSATVHSGTTANSTTVNSGGRLELFSSGLASHTVVNSGGSVLVSSDANAVEIIENGGFVSVNSYGNATFLPNSFSGTVLSDCTATVHSGTTAIEVLIRGAEDLLTGVLQVYSGGIVNSASVMSGGHLAIMENGTASFIPVESGGTLHIYGGTATGIAADSGAYLYFEVNPDTWIAGTCDGAAFEIRDGYVPGFTVTSASQLSLSGCSANGITVSNGGMFDVEGGTVGNTTVLEGGAMNVRNGSADGITVSNGGMFFIIEDGKANDTTVISGGIFDVEGGTVCYTMVSEGGSMSVSNGTALNTTVSDGGMFFIIEDGTANDTTVISGGTLSVSNGTALNTTVSDGGYLELPGGKLAGQMHFEDGSIISAGNGAVLSFDISGRTDDLPAEVEGLSLVQGTPIYLLAVSDSQENGTYRLAERAAGFNSTITVRSTSGLLSGLLLLGKTRNIGGTGYLLELKNDTLAVTVGGEVDTVAPTVTGIQADISVPTNQPVVITAVFADDVEMGSSLYRIGETGSWNDYVDGVTAYANDAFYFKAVDAAGNESEVVKYVVDNIDVSAPEPPEISASVFAATADSVILTAVFSEDSAVKEYSFDGQTWTEYQSPVTVEENRTVYFRAADALGNISQTDYIVSNIDRDPPEKPAALADVSEPTFGTVTVSAEFSEDSVKKEYSQDGGETWSTYVEPLAVSDNGVILFRGTDSAGNMSEVAGYTVSNIFHVMSGAVLSAGESASVTSGKTYDNSVVLSGGTLFVSSGGIAAGIMVEPGGELHVLSEGIAFNIVENGGYVNAVDGAKVFFVSNTIPELTLAEVSATVHSGTTANIAAVSAGGRLDVFSGGSVSSASVEPGGELHVLSGGTAFGIMEAGGYADIAEGAEVVFSPNTLSGLALADGSATVHSGTTVEDAAVNGGGRLDVFSGGNVSGVAVVGGTLNLFAGGSADTASVASGGMFIVSSGGTANGTTIGSGGSLTVLSRGTANNVSIASGGSLFVSAAGAAVNPGIGTDGSLFVFSDGVILSAAVDHGGRFIVSSGGTANGTTIRSGGRFIVSSGGKLTGQTLVEDGAIISAFSGAIMDFDISNRTPEMEACIGNLALVHGAPAFTLTISDLQMNGTYILAENAANFGNSISMRNTSDAACGELVFGGAVVLGDSSYRLYLDDDSATLSVTIQERDTVLPTVSNIQVSPAGSTGQPVVITAEFADNRNELKSRLYRIGEDGEWTAYSDGITLYHNATVSFKAVDLDENESEIAVCSVSNLGNLIGLVLSSGQTLSVLAGETFSGTVIPVNGELFVFSGGTADNTEVRGGALSVLDGGTAAATVITDGGMNVLSGGVANGITVGEDGVLDVSSGGTATGIVAADGAHLSFDVAQDTWIAGTSDGVDFEIKNGLVSDYSICFGGLTVLSGGTADKIAIRGGALTVSEGGIADGVEVGNGALTVSSGGTALNIDWTPFQGKVTIQNGAAVTFSNTCTGVYYGSGSKLFSQAAIQMSGQIASRYEMYLMSDGRTLDMTVLSGGSLHVCSGGTAVLTTVNNKGRLSVSSGGTAIGTIIDSLGSLSISSGGTALGVLLTNSAVLSVSSGAVVTNVSIEDACNLSVASGGIANGVSFCFEEERTSGSMNVNGTVTSAVIISGARVTVAGTIDSVTVSSGGRLTVSSGGKLTGKVILEKGANVSVDGTVDFDLTQIRPNSEARYSRLPAGAAHYTITVNAGQAEGVYALAEGISDSFGRTISVVNTDGDELGVFSGLRTIMIGDVVYQLAVSDNVLTLQIGGGLDPVASCGVIADAGCTVSVGLSETFYGTVINPGGTLVVSGGGKALETVENGGYADVQDGASATFVPNAFSGLVLSDTSATIHSGTTASDISVLPGGSLHVFSGGIAKDIVWTPCEGQVYLDDGAKATFVSTYSGVYYGSGDQLLSSADTMDSVSLGSSCELFVMSGGQANGAVISRGGRLSVASGGIAEDIVWTPCEGQVYLDDGAKATFVSAYSGVYFGSGDQLLSSADTMNSVSLDSSCEMHVMSDGVANAATVNSGGHLFVGSGGFVNSVAVSNGGSMHISSGGLVISVIVSSGGRMIVSSGGMAAVVHVLDSLGISSGAGFSCILISSGGHVVMEGGDAEQAVVLSGGIMTMLDDWSVNNSLTVLSGGSLLASGGTATDVSISSGAYFGVSVDEKTLISGVSDGSGFRIRDGRISDYVIESGYLDVLSGVCANNITVLSGGSLHISSGGKLTGRITCSGGVISAFDGATVEFDLSRRMPGVNQEIRLSDIQGTPSFTVTVGENQEEGTYRLVGDAVDFDRTISITNMDGVVFGSLAAGESITVADTKYSLRLSDSGMLSLAIGDPKTTDKIISGQTIASKTVSSGNVMYDTVVSGGKNISDGLYVVSGGKVYDTTLTDTGKMFVSYGGTANNTMIYDMGTLLIEYGGVANNITFFSSDNSLFVSSGAEANNVLFNGNGELFVQPGGKVDGAVFNEGGMLIVSSGGTAANVTVSSGVAFIIVVTPDTYVEGTSGGSSFEIKNGVASGCRGDSSYLFVMSGGTAYDTVLKEKCILRVLSGGTACNTVVNSDTTLQLSSGGVLTGRTFIQSGAVIRTERDAVIDFSVYAVEPGSEALFNDLTLITKPKSGTLVYTITVSDTQKPGEYSLASKGSVSTKCTLRNTRNETLGVIGSQPIVSGGYRYQLSGRVLKVVAADLIAPTVSNIQASTTEETPDPIVVTADFEDNLGELSTAQYRIGETGAWQTYNGGVTVSRNATVYFKAADIDGNISEIASYTVSNIVMVSSGLVLSGGQKDSVQFRDSFLDTVISSGGTLHVSSGGTATNTTIESGGWMFVSSGGTAAGITENGGCALLESGASVSFSSNVFSGLILPYLSSATVHSGTTAYDVGVESNGRMTVFSGGTAVNPTVSSGGWMFVSSGGTATNTTIESGGALSVLSGGTAAGITADAGVRLNVVVDQETCVSGTFDGVAFEIRDGLASGLSFDSGSLTILSGGTAANTVLGSGGSLSVSSGGTADYPTVSSGGWMFVSSGGTAANMMILSGGILSVLSGGTATGIVADAGARLNVVMDQETCVSGTSDGVAFEIRDGLASGISFDSGSLTILSGGSAVNAALGSGCTLSVSSGGTATGIVVAAGARLNFDVTQETCVSGTSDGVAFEIRDGHVSGNKVGFGDLAIFSGCTADNVLVSGKIYVSSGGTAIGATLNGGSMSVSSGGTADCTTISKGGRMFVSSGARASNVTVSSGGTLHITSGGTLTGQIVFEGRAYASAASNAVIDFDISDLKPGNAACINTLYPFVGDLNTSSKQTPIFTITVSDSQETGLYTLASDASGFSGSIKVRNEQGESLGCVLLTDTLMVGHIRYSLNLDDLDLYLKIDLVDQTAPTVSNVRASITDPTNQSVVVTAEFQDDIELTSAWYKLGENGSWTAYRDGVTVSDNTAVFFKAVDAAGNESEIVSCEVTNIDKVAPEKPVAKADITTPTNGNVIVDAVFADNVGIASAFYRIGENGEWLAYPADGVTVTENATVFFRSIDTAGNESEIVSCEVTNIDKVAPVLTLAGDTETPLQSSTLTATVDDGSEIFYSTDNETWTKYEGQLEVTANATYYFKATDAAGNEGTKQITFANIDTTAPVIDLVGDTETPLQSSTLTASVDDGSEIFYSTDNETWTKYEGQLEVTANATYYFKATDAAGNEGMKQITFGNIDTTAPVAPTASADVTTLTNGDVTVTAAFSADSAKKEFSVDGGETWQAYDAGGVIIIINGTVIFRATDEAGNISETSYEVTNIDKVAPAIPSGLAAVVVDQAVTLSWTASTDDFAGVKEYTVRYSHDGQEFTLTTTETSLALENVDFATWQWSVQAADNAGNVSEAAAGDAFTVEQPAGSGKFDFFTGCFAGGTKAMLAACEKGGNTVSIFTDGSGWGTDLVLEPGWKISGVGDFNADGRDDFLRVNGEGYVVGEMTQEDGTFVAQVLNFRNAGWSVLGTGDFNHNGSDDVLIAHPTAASETIGLLGYWESGVTWTLINGYSAEWEMIATGDFNGDGKCDMLWRNEFIGAGDLTYNAFCTWIVEPPAGESDWRMVSVANPAEWIFLCAGDFNGNGMNDIAMINGEGVVGIWGVEDGYLSSWSILSAVDTSAWALVGVADFNGDGTDDIAWSNVSSGLTGYWQINDKELTAWSNLATLS